MLLTWQFPPPRPFFLVPLWSKISASWYPLLLVAWPTVWQKEKVEPFLTVVPFKVLQVILMLFCLAESLEYIFVEKVAISSSLYSTFLSSSVIPFVCSSCLDSFAASSLLDSSLLVSCFWVS